MRTATRCVTALVLILSAAPRLVLAGSDVATDPYEVGEQLLAKKHYKTALTYFQKALKRNDVRAHYRMGLIYEETGRDRDALDQYRRYVYLSQPDARQRDAVQRAKTIEERLSKESTEAADLLEQGKRLLSDGNYREAERVLLQAAETDTSRPEIHFSLGEVYLQLEEYAKAKAAYTKAKASY